MRGMEVSRFVGGPNLAGRGSGPAFRSKSAFVVNAETVGMRFSRRISDSNFHERGVRSRSG
jgi:hypothetical protein